MENNRPQIKVLFVEDDETKYERTLALLTERIEKTIEIIPKQVGWYDAAVSELLADWYDVVILDLMLPLSDHGPVDHTYAETLTNRITSSEFPSSPYIIGLTSHKNKARSEGKFFEDKMLNLEIFHQTETDWADKIANKIRYISKQPQAGGFFNRKKYLSDVVILVAKYENEFIPIDKKINWIAASTETHPLFSQVKIKSGSVGFGRDNVRKVILVELPEMGLAAAASFTTQLSIIFRPRVFATLGMCCGFTEGIHPSGLGDLIIAETSVCWDQGKYDDTYSDTEDGYKYRPRPLTLNERMRPVIDKFLRLEGAKFCKNISNKSPHKKMLKSATFKEETNNVLKLHRGKLLTGSSVVSDPKIKKTVLKRAPDAAGIDMEVYGVYSAVSNLCFMDVDYLAIKGVADFGENKVNGKYDNAQVVASANSYELFAKVMTAYFDEH